jgi:hypothetical protein
MKNRLFAVIAFLAIAMTSMGANSTNAAEARKMFDSTYNMVFGEQGSTLHYNVNIIGILKVDGTIWYKGKKSRFVESRYLSWNDGVKDYWVDQKKKTVTLYDAGSEKKDKYSSKFEFHPNDYDYSWENSKEGYVILMNAHKNTKGIKHIKAIIDKKTKAPISLKIKVLWFWTTVNISRFQSGNIKDDVFTFPAAKYKDYKFIDERKKG